MKKNRLGKFNSKLIKRYDRYDKALARDMMAMFLAGMSIQNIDMFSSQLLGRKTSAAEVSTVLKLFKWEKRQETLLKKILVQKSIIKS